MAIHESKQYIWNPNTLTWDEYNNQPNSHASSASTYGLGSTANYGHVKTINSLTQSSHADGTALSAYQGYLLEQNKTPKYASIVAISANTTLTTTHVNAILFVTGAYTLTIPASTFTAGSQITIVRTGTGTVTITAASGVSLNGTSAGSKAISTQYKMMTLICYSTNVWYEAGV